MNVVSRNELFLLEEVIKKNFASKYKDSVLGIFWSVLQPLLMMILLTMVFSSFFRGYIEHYAVYFLSARCIFNFFSVGVNVAMNSFKGNQNILKKSATPKHIFVIGAIVSEFLNFLISLVILVIVMIVTGVTFHFHLIFLSIIPIFSLILMITGLSFMLSIVCVYYTDIRHLWSVVTLLLMYASALFYPMSIIPEPYRSYMLLNPLFWIIEQFRHFILYGSLPNILNIFDSLIISLIILIIGIIVYKKYEKTITMKL